MKVSSKSMAIVALVLLPAWSDCFAADFGQGNLSISMIRTVGDYAGDTYDNTIELWFTTPLAWPSGSPCTDTRRVYVDKKHQHIISAAYIALSAGKKANINIDSALPIRGGACEVSFLDIMAQ